LHSMAQLMLIVDGAAVIVALPSISGSLHVR
jgi:hypothetical protein